jgi:EmrB/QacA subfamily drug resistance transporter
MTTMTRPAEPVAPPEPSRSKREIYTAMSGLIIAILLAMLDNLIVGTAMPTIVGELGGLAHLSWVVTGYALATAVSTPVWAKLGDLYGRKGVFMASIVVFLIGSSLAGLSRGMGELIAFRGVQGLGAGGLMVGAMAIIGDLVPLRERGRYQGLMAAVMPVAFIGGPLLGGLLTDHLSWRWAFYINLPLGVLALLVTAVTMHLPGRRGEVSVDWSGAGLLAVGVAALTLLASWGGIEYPWVSAPILGLTALSMLALAAFVSVERRVDEPILPLRLFTSRNFTSAVVLTFLTGLAMFGAVTFLPQFQQMVQGASATSSGLLLLPLLGGMLVTSLLGGQLVSRTGRYRGLLLAGSLLMAAGLGLLGTMGVATSQVTTAVWMVVLGVGMGMLMQTTMLVVQNSVGQPDLGAATGAATLFRTIGGSLGVSLFGTLFAQQLPAGLSGAGGGHLTPAMLAGLPAAVRDSCQHAVTTGVDLVFRWGALIALLAVVAAWLIREVPLRGLPSQLQPSGSDEIPHQRQGTAPRRKPAHRYEGGPDQWLVTAGAQHVRTDTSSPTPIS